MKRAPEIESPWKLPVVVSKAWRRFCRPSLACSRVSARSMLTSLKSSSLPPTSWITSRIVFRFIVWQLWAFCVAREFSINQDVSRAESEVDELLWLEEGSMWKEDWTWSHSRATCEGSKKKGVSSSGCYMCGWKGHMARDCKSKSDSGQYSARGSGSNEASEPGANKQGCFKCGQPGFFARECKQGRIGFFSCCATISMKGDNLFVDLWCPKRLSSLALRGGAKGHLSRARTARRKGLRAKD